MTDQTSNLSLPYILPAQAQKHVTHNEALRMLDAILQLAVLDRDLTAPPAGPAEGDRYIVAAGAAGAWAGHDGEVAAWQDGAWAFLVPRPGWLAWVADEAAVFYRTDDGWTPLASAIAALQNLALLGVGTAADASNPFAAKLNKALWTAKTAGEGGDGDLRYTLNKEGGANVLSLLMQSGWSGRAELGLVGDDDLALKVSADGESWTEAMRVGRANGNMRIASLTIGTDAPEPTSFMSLVNSDGTPKQIDLYNNANVGFRATRVDNSSASGVNVFRKARGTIASPQAVASGDMIGAFNFNYYDGATYKISAQLVARCVAAVPSPSDGAGQVAVLAAAPGSGTASEILRLEHATGLSMFGANPVIDQNRHLRLRAYTVAALPAATPAGQMIYVSNGAANKRLAVSDGTNWRWPDGETVT